MFTGTVYYHLRGDTNPFGVVEQSFDLYDCSDWQDAQRELIDDFDKIPGNNELLSMTIEKVPNDPR